MNQDPSAKYSLTPGGADLLDRVGPLWLQLRQHHADVSPRWSSQLFTVSFAERRAGLIAKAGKGLLVVLASAGDQDVGYCVSTVAADAQGEIDSLFVQSTHRKLGIGHALILNALEWFGKQSVSAISVEVMAGNEAAWPFYARYGFYPRTVRLRQMNSMGDRHT